MTHSSEPLRVICPFPPKFIKHGQCEKNHSLSHKKITLIVSSLDCCKCWEDISIAAKRTYVEYAGARPVAGKCNFEPLSAQT